MFATRQERLRLRLPCAAASLALLAALTGCGTSGPARLDLADAHSLQGMLAAVRGDARRGERTAALAGLGALRRRIESLSASGALPAGETQALLTGIARALAAAQRELAPPPAITEPAAAAEPPPPQHEHAREHKAQGDHGRGHRHKGDGGEGARAVETERVTSEAVGSEAPRGESPSAPGVGSD